MRVKDVLSRMGQLDPLMRVGLVVLPLALVLGAVQLLVIGPSTPVAYSLMYGILLGVFLCGAGGFRSRSLVWAPRQNERLYHRYVVVRSVVGILVGLVGGVVAVWNLSRPGPDIAGILVVVLLASLGSAAFGVLALVQERERSARRRG